jgi:hypothetical protein
LEIHKMPNDCNCPVVNKEEWDLKKHNWGKKAFYRTKHFLCFHIPIGIGGAISRGFEKIKEKGYTVNSPYMMLDDETGFFTANMLIAIEEIPENDPDIVIWDSASLYSKYYHGPFKGLSEEIGKLIEFVDSKEKKKPAKIYTWVTNCPKCWKQHGGPTTVIFARI